MDHKADAQIDHAIKDFYREVDKVVFDHDEKEGMNAIAQGWGRDRYREVGMDWGRRYVRFWVTNGPDSRSAYCFVDRDNGNILKPDGWKKPSPIPRGNVLDRAERQRAVTPYGARYMRATAVMLPRVPPGGPTDEWFAQATAAVERDRSIEARGLENKVLMMAWDLGYELTAGNDPHHYKVEYEKLLHLADHLGLGAKARSEWEDGKNAGEDVGKQAAAKPKGQVQEKVYDYVSRADGKGVDMSDMAAYKEFRGVHWGDIQKAVQALAKAGLISYEGMTLKKKASAKSAAKEGWYAHQLGGGSRPRLMTGPFPSAAAAKKYLKEHDLDRGPFKIDAMSSGSEAGWVGEGWAIEKIVPKAGEDVRPPRKASAKTAGYLRGVEKHFPRGSYLYNFFSEKNIPERTFDVEDSQGLSHSIPNEVVVEHIAQTRGRERAQIEDILRKIDFHNGDVNHFLAHLAEAIANQYGGAMRFSSPMVARVAMQYLTAAKPVIVPVHHANVVAVLIDKYGYWGVRTKSGLTTSYKDETKWLYQLKNEFQVPPRQAEQLYSELKAARDAQGGKRASDRVAREDVHEGADFMVTVDSRHDATITIYWPIANMGRRGKTVNVRTVNMSRERIAYDYDFFQNVKKARTEQQANALLDAMIADVRQASDGTKIWSDYTREYKGVDPSLPTPTVSKVEDIKGADITVNLNAKPIMVYSKSDTDKWMNNGNQTYWFKVHHRFKMKLDLLRDEIAAARGLDAVGKILTRERIPYDYHVYMMAGWD